MPRAPRQHNSGERQRGKRAGLDLQQIVQAARTLEVETLSMQSLADALGVDRKALNYHVKDRQTLLGLVALDAFSSHLVATSINAAADWQTALRLYGRAIANALAELGQLSDHLWFDDLLTAWGLQANEALFEHLHKAGFNDNLALRVVTMVITQCLGHARDLQQAQALGGTERPRHRSLRTALLDVDGQAYDNLNRVIAAGIDTYDNAQIDLALEIIIAGAQARLTADTPTRPSTRKRAD